MFMNYHQPLGIVIACIKQTKYFIKFNENN